MAKTSKEMAEILEPLFLLNRWTWRGNPVPPTVEEIEAQIDRLVDSLTSNPDVTIAACGRIEVYRELGESKEIRVALALGYLVD